MAFSNSNSSFSNVRHYPLIPGRNSVFKRLIYPLNNSFKKPTVSFLDAGVIGPIPILQRCFRGKGPLIQFCSHCLSPDHTWPNCKNLVRCRRCLLPGHVSGNCCHSPRMARFHSRPYAASNSRVFRSTESLITGPAISHAPKLYLSLTEYIKEHSGIHSPPPPITISWRRPWRIQAPEFVDDEGSPSPDSVCDHLFVLS
jgi:hypothetical protein